MLLSAHITAIQAEGPDADLVRLGHQWAALLQSAYAAEERQVDYERETDPLFPEVSEETINNPQWQALQTERDTLEERRTRIRDAILTTSAHTFDGFRIKAAAAVDFPSDGYWVNRTWNAMSAVLYEMTEL